jgi:hypothetical protein
VPLQPCRETVPPALRLALSNEDLVLLALRTRVRLAAAMTEEIQQTFHGFLQYVGEAGLEGLQLSLGRLHRLSLQCFMQYLTPRFSEG